MYNDPILMMKLAHGRHDEMLGWARHRNLVRSLRAARRRHRNGTDAPDFVSTANTVAPFRTRVPAVGTADFQRWVAGVGQDVADRGTIPMAVPVAGIVAIARRYRVEPVCAAILASDDEPEVARQRAFARVVAALAELRPLAATGRAAA